MEVGVFRSRVVFLGRGWCVWVEGSDAVMGFAWVVL